MRTVKFQRSSRRFAITCEKVKIVCSFTIDLELDGIFRVSAGVNQVQEVISLINKGGLEELNLQKLNPHTSAALLKMFFRELPDPVFTFALWDPLIESTKISNEEERFSKISQLLKSLPPENYRLLKYLFTFLREVEAKSAVNRMTATNLGIVIGPNILRPEVETIETSLSSPQVNRVVEDAITNFDSVFA